jgi:hypothetical protein
MHQAIRIQLDGLLHGMLGFVDGALRQAAVQQAGHRALHYIHIG